MLPESAHALIELIRRKNRIGGGNTGPVPQLEFTCVAEDVSSGPFEVTAEMSGNAQRNTNF